MRFHVLTRLEVSAHLTDARGRACPQPIIDLAKALKFHPRVELWADDPAAKGDVEAFCVATGHALEMLTDDGVLQVLVRRRG